MSRMHYLDALRGILMVLGVFLHAANMYHLDGSWLVSDTDQSIVFNYVTDVIHVFRMPAFFIISGYFSWFLYCKYGVFGFLKDRFFRILIPLLVTLFVINLLQAYLLYTMNDVKDFFSYLFSNGVWLSHLWFLAFLAMYTIIAFLLFPVFERCFCFFKGYSVVLFRLFPFFVYGLFSIFFVVLRVVGSLWPNVFHDYSMGFSLTDIFIYLFYFLLGVIVCWKPYFIDYLLGYRLSLSALFVIAGFFVLTYFDDSSLLYKAGFSYFSGLLSLVSTFIVWGLFKRFFDRKIKVMHYLSQASYSVYIFHHILIVAMGLALYKLSFNIYLEFFMIVLVTFSITMAIHFMLIEKNPVLAFLFNGRRR